MTTTTAKKMDKVEEATAKLIELFESGELPEAVAKTLIQSTGDVPSATWSLNNQLLMMLAGTADGRTYRAWQDVGRQVRKGAKAFYILKPIKKTIFVEDDETGETVKKHILIGFEATPRFRYEDTDGDELSVVDYTPVELPPLMEVAERLNVPVTWAPGNGDAYGAYSPGLNEIRLYSENVSTFFHELAHAAHATIEKLKGGQDSYQELVAESVAAVLCIMHGYEGYIPHSADYISSYAGSSATKNPAKAVISVLSTVQKVLDVILNGGEA